MGFDEELKNLERGQRLMAEGYDAEAESAKDDLAELDSMWPQGPPDSEIRRHTDRIVDFSTRARISRRRADHAAAGYLLASPD